MHKHLHGEITHEQSFLFPRTASSERDDSRHCWETTWGRLEVNLPWCCKLLFPQGQDTVCPLRLESESWSVTGGGNQETGRWNGRSWSRDSTMTNQTSDSLWASRTPGTWGGSCPWYRDCRLRRKTTLNCDTSKTQNLITPNLCNPARDRHWSCRKKVREHEAEEWQMLGVVGI